MLFYLPALKTQVNIESRLSVLCEHNCQLRSSVRLH